MGLYYILYGGKPHGPKTIIAARDGLLSMEFRSSFVTGVEANQHLLIKNKKNKKNKKEKKKRINIRASRGYSQRKTHGQYRNAPK